MRHICVFLMSVGSLSTSVGAQSFTDAQFDRLLQEVRGLRGGASLGEAQMVQLTNAIQARQPAFSDSQFERLLGALTSSELEKYYWLSQVALTVITLLLLIVATTAAVVAWKQVRALKLFEMLKYIQSSDVRQARRTVLREIKPIGWVPERLEEDASTVCSSYDVLGRLLMYEGGSFRKGSLESFFAVQWAPSIVDNYQALEDFIRVRKRKRGKDYMRDPVDVHGL